MPFTETGSTTEEEFEGILQEALDDTFCGFDAHDIRSLSTFAEAGILTANRGLVVRMEDGSEFQVTIVRSR